MPTDLEQLLKDLFGDSLNRLNQFQTDQVKRLQAKLQEIAHEALKDELVKIHTELNALRERVATLEAERAEAAAESLESSF
jgi:predicted nuclease with TOPRIM domain